MLQVGKQQRLVKAGAIRTDPCGQGGAGQRPEPIIEGQRDKAGARGDHTQTKLFGDLISQSCGTHFWDGFATRCDDKIGGRHGLSFLVTDKGGGEVGPVVGNVADGCLQHQLRSRHLRVQHRDDVLG